MKVSHFFSSLLLAAVLHAGVAHAATSQKVACACQGLPSVVYPKDDSYPNLTTAYWDIRANLSPSCIFLPQSADDVASALRTLHECDSTFAIRGGGHMNFPGSNGIEEGVLISLEHMNAISYNERTKTVNVAPGARWVDVYDSLDRLGRYTIGGRLKTIGVPGLTLIGGYHYFINKYGFTMDNVVRYEAVLGNGTKVVASRTSHPDLFWGLKGSANNLALVTNFEFSTYPIARLSTTIQTFADDEIEDFLDATVDFLKKSDSSVGAGGIFTISLNSSTGLFSASLLGAQEGTSSPPSKFGNFSRLNATLRRNAVLRPVEWHSQFDTPFQAQRIQFVSHTMKPSKTQLRYLYREWRKAILDIGDVQGLYGTLVVNLTPKSAIAVGKRNGVGNLWEDALDEEDLLIWQFATSWAAASDDLRMSAWSETLAARLHAENKAKDLAHPLLYMGDAGEFQNPFQTFFSANTLRRLRRIRKEYDPALVFTRNVWGGFKMGF